MSRGVKQRAEGFELAQFVPYRLSVVAERVSRLIAGVYAERFDLSIPEWRVVAHLGNSAALTALEVAERTAMDKVKVSRAVARLTTRGLVRREVNPLDQRGIMLSLTPAGRGVYDGIVPAALEMERDVLRTLPARDVAELIRILDAIDLRVAAISGDA